MEAKSTSSTDLLVCSVFLFMYIMESEVKGTQAYTPCFIRDSSTQLSFSYFVGFLSCHCSSRTFSFISYSMFCCAIDFGPYFDHNKCFDHHCDICTFYDPAGVADPLNIQVLLHYIFGISTTLSYFFFM